VIRDDALHGATEPYDNGHLYYNFAHAPADASTFYTDDGVIVANHPIRPGDTAIREALVETRGARAR
jgi:hypothetical protein